MRVSKKDGVVNSIETHAALLSHKLVRTILAITRNLGKRRFQTIKWKSFLYSFFQYF